MGAVAGSSRIELAVPDAAAMNAHLRDIEAGALFLRSNANPPVGEPVELALVLPGGAPLLVSGRVSRIEADGFGLALDPPSDAVRAALAAAKLSAPPLDLPSALARIDKLTERVTHLQREAETNRAFYARALQQAHGPAKSGGLRWDHFLSVGIGFGCGVVLTLGILVARTPGPPPLPRPVAVEPAATRSGLPVVPAAGQPPPTPSVQLTLRDAGTTEARHAVPVHNAAAVVADDSGTLNLLTTGDADVFVDGRHIGRSPIRGMVMKPGDHSVRVACLKDAARSAEQRVNVPAFSDVDVEHACE
jgi:hypothetical protein